MTVPNNISYVRERGMKTLKSMSLFFAVILSAIFLTACPKDKDTTMRDLTLLAVLASRPSTGSLLNTEQYQSSSTASAASSAASSSTSATGATAFVAQPDTQKLIAGIMENGRDPVYAREAVRAYHEKMKKSDKGELTANLAALTATSTGGTTSGTYGTAGWASNKTYNISGFLDGIVVTTTNVDVGASNPYFGGSCIVSAKTLVPGAKKGTVTFNPGSTLAWAVTAGSGTYTTALNLTFADYGSYWIDMYTYIALLKQMISGTFTIAGGTPCEIYKNMYELYMNRIIQYNVLNGNMTGSATSKYSYTPYTAGGTYISSSSGSSSVQSSNLTLDGTAVTPLNINYSYSSNVTVSGMSAASGSFSITISGTVSGKAINDTLTVSF